ncbi:hypothetical protein Cch01nite_33800 [Cellulomonas chitinilytica]|uniref:DUF2530 domain-containing protein n=1 Tax=Cellulomonas chitinilytica TaxID=398759 RepID=A0A919U2U3_9CELL|nr:DUF2530 domain-containing protein [Cellulomonas chitinilytica]GIG22656.1 hypothetical protein Cch01nite_33800 [Cellulomonas chitinilytica]
MPLIPRATRTPPAPVPVDLGRVMLVGTALWLVALAVCTVLAAVGTATWMPVWVCLAGIATGAFGWDWARRHRTTPPDVAPPA